MLASSRFSSDKPVEEELGRHQHEKFLALGAPVIGRDGAEALAAAVLGADRLANAAELLRLTRPG